MSFLIATFLTVLKLGKLDPDRIFVDAFLIFFRNSCLTCFHKNRAISQFDQSEQWVSVPSVRSVHVQYASTRIIGFILSNFFLKDKILACGFPVSEIKLSL